MFAMPTQQVLYLYGIMPTQQVLYLYDIMPTQEVLYLYGCHARTAGALLTITMQAQQVLY
jgi:hypothetical protein